MKKFIIILIGIILAVGSFIGFFSLFNNTDDSDIYQGIVTFDNQADFGVFKHEIADKAIDIYNLNILNTNYPILISSHLGKDRTGIAAALLLYVLGVPEYNIEEDYLASNKYIDPKKTITFSEPLAESLQEAMTALFSANSAYLNYAFDYIRETYGSLDEYLEKEVRVSKGKKIILRKLMLYNP